MMWKYFKKRNKNQGFTLVETLVAISIFTTSILVMMSILAKGISNTESAKRKVTATYLAQEGVEYMRNMRDTFVLYFGNSQTGWNNFHGKLIGASCFNAGGCYFDSYSLDYTNPSEPMAYIFLGPPNSPQQPLWYDSATGIYSDGFTTGAMNSGYTRTIRATVVGSWPSNEMKITSTVTWTQGSGNYSVSFSENLFNWVE